MIIIIAIKKVNLILNYTKYSTDLLQTIQQHQRKGSSQVT